MVPSIIFFFLFIAIGLGADECVDSTDLCRTQGKKCFDSTVPAFQQNLIRASCCKTCKEAELEECNRRVISAGVVDPSSGKIFTECQHNSKCRLASEGDHGFICECVDLPARMDGWGKMRVQEIDGELCENKDECFDNPCGDHGKCHDLIGQYVCECDEGYNGKHCEEKTNQCIDQATSHSVCQNGASCVDGETDFTCHCPLGFKGKYCEVEINECDANPCHLNNTEKCVDGKGSYKCQCKSGFTGRRCEVNIDDCTSAAKKSCNEDSGTGYCVDRIVESGFRCVCARSYIGEDCSEKKDYCASEPCGPNAICISGNEEKFDLLHRPNSDYYPNGYQCACKEGFINVSGICILESVCRNVTACNAGGVCVDATIDSSVAPGKYICQCAVGRMCDKKTSPTSCYNLDARHDLRLKGDNCNIDVNECENVQCKNGSSCIESNTVNPPVNWPAKKAGFMCAPCGPKHFGTFCENEHNDCTDNNCGGHGKCTNVSRKEVGAPSFVCTCDKGWEKATGIGAHWEGCTINTNECDYETLNNCGENSICIDTVGSYECRCKAGYKATDPSNHNCKEIDECKPSETPPHLRWKAAPLGSLWKVGNPCGPNGYCIDGISNFQCSCQPGYTGRFCQININDCTSSDLCKSYLPSPDHNKNKMIQIIPGTCEDLIDDYRCVCAPGFERDITVKGGDNCLQNIDDCVHNKCKNGGQCVDRHLGFDCLCPDGFTGVRCEIDIDDCVNDPCHGSVCIDGVNSFTCICRAGTYGATCSSTVDTCSQNSDTAMCGHGKCIDGVRSALEVSKYSCICEEGWEQDDATEMPSCTKDVDECADELLNDCAVNATCSNTRGGYQCTCRYGYVGDGKTCTEINECSDNPCQNGSSCVEAEDVNGAFAVLEAQKGARGGRLFSCHCLPGWEGEFCSDQIDLCKSKDPGLQKCHATNTKTCVPTFMGMQCDCKEGYTGSYCEEETVECTPNICLFGTCNEGVASFSCDCDVGYEKDSSGICSIDTNECEVEAREKGIVCSGNGECFESNSSNLVVVGEQGHCKCYENFWGTDCSSSSEDCVEGEDTVYCGHGTCITERGATQTETSYTCDCDEGWQKALGDEKACTRDIDECVEGTADGVVACPSNSICTNTPGSFTCTCLPGFQEINGECTDMTECEPMPCYNGVCKESKDGAIVQDTGLRYICVCPPGFSGVHCEEDIDECRFDKNLRPLKSPLPCSPNGTCVDLVGGYECDCGQSGFTGVNCEIPINDCKNIDCGNGDAIDGQNECNCKCHFGWRKDKSGSCTVDFNECADLDNDDFIDPSKGEDGDPVKSRRSHCNGHGQCLESSMLPGIAIGHRVCECDPEYGGNACEVAFNDCEGDVVSANGFSSLCGNGTCVDGVREVIGEPNYSCTCDTGWQKGGGSAGSKKWNSAGAGSSGRDGSGRFACTEDVNECTDPSLHNCHENATCVNKQGSFDCLCNHGYFGAGLMVDGFGCFDFDECNVSSKKEAEHPCKNGSACTESSIDPTVPAGEYFCDCSGTGFSGKTCEVKEKGCNGNTACGNHGKCVEEENNYRCECNPGWMGEYCDVDVNECNDLVNGNPCTENEECINSDGSFSCVCRHGYVMSHDKKGCVDEDECQKTDCSGFGKCVDSMVEGSGVAVGDFFCICDLNHDGIDCSIEINDCKPNICGDNGKCINVPRTTRGKPSFRCECDKKWESRSETDPTCSVFVDTCYHPVTGKKQHSCADHSQVCVDGRDGPSCKCADGYSGGVVCTLEMQEPPTNDTLQHTDCAITPTTCLNGGTCHTGEFAFDGVVECKCPPGYEGTYCGASKLDACHRLDSNGETACLNGAICEVVPDSNDFDAYKCTCLPGWKGKRCEIDIDECSGAVSSKGHCSGHGICQDSISDPVTLSNPDGVLAGSRRCDCDEGWYGASCSTTSNSCIESDVTMCGYGTCVNEADSSSYSCNCKEGWTKDKNGICSVNVNECLELPCNGNRPVCLDTLGSYLCECLPGYQEGIVIQEEKTETSKTCIDVNECADPNACYNDGICTPTVAGAIDPDTGFRFSCKCKQGFTGPRCEFYLDLCQSFSNPCGVHGKCKDLRYHELLEAEEGAALTKVSTTWSCECSSGWTSSGLNAEGPDCKLNIDDCQAVESPCNGNGTCTDLIDDYSCQCTPGYVGRYCETNVDDCKHKCSGHGVCTDLVNGFKCACEPGFIGEKCQYNGCPSEGGTNFNCFPAKAQDALEWSTQQKNFCCKISGICSVKAFEELESGEAKLTEDNGNKRRAMSVSLTKNIGSPITVAEKRTYFYGNPFRDGGCRNGEREVQVDGLVGTFCSPQCASVSWVTERCPTHLPPGVTAVPTCALKSQNGGGEFFCALVCSGSIETKALRLGDRRCGEEAKCNSFKQFKVGLCTYENFK